MTADDAKIIFSNVSELAIFADLFTEELDLALGDVVEGGQGEDYVGALFLRIIPDLESRTSTIPPATLLRCNTCRRYRRRQRSRHT